MMPNDGYFDADVAATYDQVHIGDPSVIAPMVNRLHSLAGGGPALEFAIGTGRVALPLAAQGTPVSGIELSRAMVEQLRAKPGGADMDITIGDMTTTRVNGPFALVFLVYNTIDNLTTQEAQLACFANAARHLAPGGRFVIETLVPPIQKIPLGQSLLAQDRTDSHWCIDAFDVVTQTYSSHHIRMENGETRRLSIPFRYAWPAEFDLMARAAGMHLEHRWADWSGTPLTATSRAHVSVWRKA